jgi:hypothetical protein
MSPEIRLMAGLKACGLRQADIARAAEVTDTMVTHVKRGSVPGLRVWRTAAELLHTSPEWLMNGTGPAPSWWSKVEDLEVEYSVKPGSQVDAKVLLDVLNATNRRLNARLARIEALLERIHGPLGPEQVEGPPIVATTPEPPLILVAPKRAKRAHHRAPVL